MNIDRADMKLLIEAGYSGVMRGIDTDLEPIFQAIAEWMPQYAAGSIGLAMLELVAGNLAKADEMLTAIIRSDKEGRAEAKAILAMCKTLQQQQAEAERLAEELKGSGGHPEAFTDALINGGEETTHGNQGLALESEAAPARHGDNGPRVSTNGME